jgi:hypothetical protein
MTSRLGQNQVVISGSSSGTATVAVPAAAGTPTLTLPTTTGTLALTTNLFAVGQTWQDVIGSRAKRTTYQNTTGKPIVVSISFTANFSSQVQIYVGTTTDPVAAGVMVAQDILYVY